jgi:hypothetical protein
MELSLTEQLCYCTVRIECQNDTGQISNGSGFFFNFKKSETEIIPIVVTNKHVVNGMSIGRFIMTKADSNGNPTNTDHFTVTLTNLQSFVKQHPDGDVDLCALMLAPILNHAQQNGIRLFYKSFDIGLIPTAKQLEELTALEDILMIGYPNSIWDSTNNMPILRRGSTATHPCIDYNGKKEFMIDAACFPGSSGSPVLIYNPSGYTTKTGNIIMGSSRVLLVGVLYAGPQHTATGEIKVMTVPTFQQPVAFSRIPNNLGVVIKSERILELEKLFN